MQKAWQDNPEPPDHDEPTLRDRLEAMPKDELVDILATVAEEHPETVICCIRYAVDVYEQEQLAKVATP